MFPATLLKGFLDEPLLVSRADGELRCLSNVCTHRGMILVEKPCSADLIRCSYHGRRFSLDGKLLSMPEFENVEDFPAESDNLRRVELCEKSGFLFAAIDPLASLGEFIAETPLAADLNNAFAPLVSTREYEIEAHWALYCENYLEGFHIPFVHKSLNETIDYGTYTTEIFRYSSLQTAFDSGGRVAGKYLFVFPNTMFNFYSWGISVNVVRPVLPNKTIVSFLTYATNEAEAAGVDLHQIEIEDERVVESVQKGIRSRFYDSGRYSPLREQGTHHFHRLIAEFME